MPPDVAVNRLKIDQCLSQVTSLKMNQAGFKNHIIVGWILSDRLPKQFLGKLEFIAGQADINYFFPDQILLFGFDQDLGKNVQSNFS